MSSEGSSGTSSLPLVPGEHVFEIPTKLIKTNADMKIWEKSEAYFEYMGFILAVNESIKGKSNSKGSLNPSENVINVIKVLDRLDAILEDTPPVQQPQRFGNVAFRTWYQKMKNESLNLLTDLLTAEKSKAIPEIVCYLVEGFGNSTRIDYGTGHEISFLMFLCCLYKIGALTDQDRVATGCYIFPRYLHLARKLQKTYRMEPAGSHGVWSLDDFQFVPFIWGSSQLIAHPTIEPNSFLNTQILNEFGDDYMFLTCIQFINSVKSGPFAEHSNQLWSISGVSSWSKINSGLIKMYKAEVLSKFPVVQHIVFGTLFTLKPIETSSGMMTPKFGAIPAPGASPSSSISSKENSAVSTVKSSSSSSGSDFFRMPAGLPQGQSKETVTSREGSVKSDEDLEKSPHSSVSGDTKKTVDSLTGESKEQSEEQFVGRARRGRPVFGAPE